MATPDFSLVMDNLARQRSRTGWKPVPLIFSFQCNQQTIWGQGATTGLVTRLAGV